ncbi:MAG: FecR domain-containing protein [Desulfovibrionaceae bacterium]
MPEASQPTPIGTVAVLTGHATASLDGASRELAPGSPVFENETVATAAASTLELHFNDGTVLAQSAASSVVLDDYVYDPNTGSAELLFQLTEGGLRAVSGEIVKANPDGFVIETPLATVGIRGTAFFVLLTPDGQVVGVEQMDPEHIVQVQTPQGLMNIATQGEFIAVQLDGFMSDPSQITEDLVQQLREAIPLLNEPSGSFFEEHFGPAGHGAGETGDQGGADDAGHAGGDAGHAAGEGGDAGDADGAGHAGAGSGLDDDPLAGLDGLDMSGGLGLGELIGGGEEGGLADLTGALGGSGAGGLGAGGLSGYGSALSQLLAGLTALLDDIRNDDTDDIIDRTIQDLNDGSLPGGGLHDLALDTSGQDFANDGSWLPVTGTFAADNLSGHTTNPYSGSVIYGLSGDDSLYGDTGDDILFGGNDDDYLVGNGGDDVIYGGSGNDCIEGGQGHDYLVGGSGNDTFIFSTIGEVGDNGYDTIRDFTHGEDALELPGFQGVSGVLNQSGFSGAISGQTGTSLVYDPSDGKVWYDQDLAHDGGETLVCVLENTPASLDANDILVLP